MWCKSTPVDLNINPCVDKGCDVKTRYLGSIHCHKRLADSTQFMRVTVQWVDTEG